MRALILHRQPFGGINTYSQMLSKELSKQDIQTTVLEASKQIPNESGSKVDKGVTVWLKETAGDADIVHAIGYRAAWACAEAFGYNEAWVYSAFDLPKTTNGQLIDRLNRSQCGFCASNAIWRELDKALALDLSVIYPGVDAAREPTMDRKEARKTLGLPEDALIVGAMGRWDKGNGFRELIDSMYHVTAEHGNARLALAGKGPEEGEFRHRADGLPDPEAVHFLGQVDDSNVFLAALDLFVVSGSRCGTSMGALEAMSEGVPVLLRNAGGLSELIVEEVSGYLFDSDEQLGTRIGELLSMPLGLETVGRAGRIRVLERFTIEQSAQSVVESYQSVTQDLLP